MAKTPPRSAQKPRKFSLPRTLGISALLLCLSGCVADDDLAKVLTSFQTSSAALTSAYQAFLLNANNVEAQHYIDEQAAQVKFIDTTAIARTVLLTDDEIQLRLSAIKALTDYNTALVTLASSKDTAKINADLQTASASIATLGSDGTKAFANPAITSFTTRYAGTISSAVAGMGIVIDLALRHHNLNAVRESIDRQDPKLIPLLDAISDESRSLYILQKRDIDANFTAVLHDYNLAASHPDTANQADLLQFADRIKQARLQQAALPAANPTKATEDFKKVHESLIDTVTSSGAEQKESGARLIAEVKSFAADVTPLTQTSAAKTAK